MPFGGNSSSPPCSVHAGTAALGGIGGSTGQVGNSQSFSGNLPVESKAIFFLGDPTPLAKHRPTIPFTSPLFSPTLFSTPAPLSPPKHREKKNTVSLFRIWSADSCMSARVRAVLPRSRDLDQMTTQFPLDSEQERGCSHILQWLRKARQ